PFRGPVTIERIEHFTTTLFLLGMVGVGGGPLAARIPESNERDPSSHVFSAEELRDLPSSHLTLLGTLSAASLLPDADGVVAYLDSRRAGYVETAISCFTERRRKQLAPWLRQLSREELRKLADSHVGFALTGQIDKEYQEAAVTRQFPTERRLGLAYFVSRNG